MKIFLVSIETTIGNFRSLSKGMFYFNSKTNL